jgi:hypothetical protein
MGKKAPTEPMDANRLAMVMRYLWLPRRRCKRKTPGQWLLRFPTPGSRRYANDLLPSSALKLRPPANERRTDGEGVRLCSSRLGHQNKIGSCWK